jgi:hypothetical protein
LFSGFSFVYLAEGDNKDLFAVKTIRCKMGKEVAENAIREAIITNRFQHENIIKIVVIATTALTDNYLLKCS